MKIIKRLISLVVTLAMLGGIALLAAYIIYERSLSLPVQTRAHTAQGDVTLSFPEGSTVDDLLAKIASRQPELHSYSAEVLRYGLRLTERSRRLQAGSYHLINSVTNTPYTIDELLDKMVEGDVIQYSVTIPEGWTFSQMREKIDALPNIEHVTESLTDIQILEEVAGDDTEYEHPEGLFLANTYFYHDGMSDLDIYQRAFDALQLTLDEYWADHDPNESEIKTPYEALVLASMIERETGLDAERNRVSGVFHRRLAIGMRLQSDPTVIYALGDDYDGTIYRSDLQRESPYNTYTVNGLPPTPISLVGHDSIEAALNPDDGEALYFVADAKGGHRFAKTLDEHNKNVRLYRQAIAE